MEVPGHGQEFSEWKTENVRKGNRKFNKKKIRTGKMAENPKEKICLLVNLFHDWVL